MASESKKTPDVRAKAARESGERAIDWCRANGAEIVFPGERDFPFAISHLERVPNFFCYFGRPVWRELPCLSVVGSRDPSLLAKEWLDVHLAEFLRSERCAVVSGGARGIDQQAHWLALRAGRPTVVFLPSGLANPYPQEWAKWKDEVIAGGGAIVSTNVPERRIHPALFEERNRWIAALGRLLFVVEARRKSGTAMTARLARELDRTVCVLPGSPADPRCAGGVDLLFEGAFPVRDALDLSALFALSATPGAG